MPKTIERQFISTQDFLPSRKAGGVQGEVDLADHVESLSPLQNIGVWGSSLGFHLLILLLCSLIYVTIENQQEFVSISTFVSDIDQEIVLTDITQEMDNWDVNSDAPVSLTPTKTVIEPTPTPEIAKDPMTEMDVADASDPLSVALDSMELDATVEGVEGKFVNTEGDAGSVDRITLEIINRLEKGKVLVVWLMDASESLSTRREQVIKRFERIYKELDELAEDKAEPLLTSVVAFGKKSKLMTPQPTADFAEVMQAVKKMPTDETGVENVFAAVQTAAREYRKLQKKGYQVMLVVLTDESGNDVALLEQAIQEVKRNEMAVYVMGPVSPFGRNEMRVKWVDQETKEVLHLPVERGPESVAIENVNVPIWIPDLSDKVISSGFGPYALARLTRESNGIYFMYDDGNINGPKIDILDMLDHTPDYLSPVEYNKMVEKSPIRKAILRTAQASLEASNLQPKIEFPEGGIQFDIRDELRNLQKIDEFLNRAIYELKAVESYRPKETSERWLAHYDLLMGQLLANRIRLTNSIPLLNEMYSKPKVCKEGTTNAWALAGLEGTALIDLEESATPEEQPDESSTKKKGSKKKKHAKDASAAPSIEEDAKLARKYLQRVVTAHPGTPWAAIAERELNYPLQLKWQETFIIPPKGQKLPWDKVPLSAMTEKQKEAKKKFERFLSEKKKRDEMKEKREKDNPGKKKKIPKL